MEDLRSVGDRGWMEFGEAKVFGGRRSGEAGGIRSRSRDQGSIGWKLKLVLQIQLILKAGISVLVDK